MGKFFLGLVVVVALLVGGLTWVLSDPNRFKSELTALIEDQTGLNVRIDGELAWRLWPPVQLLAEGVAADWQQPDEDPLITVAELRLDADLLPLLSADPKLTIDGVVVDGLVANLVQTGEIANWTPPGMATTPPPVPVPGPAPAASSDWEIGIVRVSDALINYTVDGELTRVELDHLSLKQIAPDRDIPMEATARADSDGTLVNLDLSGALRTDPTLSRWEIQDMRLVGALSGPVDELPFSARINASVDAVAGTATVRDSALTLADAPFTVALDAADLNTSATVGGRLELARQPIPQLLKLFEIDHAEPVAAAFDFDADEKRARLTDLSANALGSTISGTVDYRLTGKPRADFELTVDRLVIEPTPEPIPEPSAALGAPGVLGMAAAAASIPVSDAPILPLETLREFDWKGTLAIAHLIYDGAQFPNTRIDTKNNSGRVDAALNMPSFFGGTAASEISIDARTDEPVWRITPALSDVKSEPLMAWLDQKLYWVALLLVNGEFEMRGNTERALLSSISGKSRFDGGQGTMDITRLKRAVQAVAQLAGGSERIDAWPERLDYKRLTGNWTVDGQRHVLDLALDNMTLAMNGTYDPFSDLMDMKVDLMVQDDPEMNTFQVNSMLMGMAIPVRCKGPTTDPTCRADEAGVKKLVAKALTGQAGEESTERLDKAIEENVPEEHREAARQLLRGFGELLKNTPPQQTTP